MIGHPPRSPLFPYTTLFRSQTAEEEQKQHTQCGIEQHDRPVAFERRHRSTLQPVRQCAATQGTGRGRERAGALSGGDRKSTRLNSSHSQISYAVFCLTKKKTQTSHALPRSPDHPHLQPPYDSTPRPSQATYGEYTV